MAETITPADNFDTGISVATAGEKLLSAVVKEFVQKLANRTEFLKLNKLGSDKTAIDHALTVGSGGSIEWGATLYPALSSRSLGFTQNLMLGRSFGSAWEWPVNPASPIFRQASLSDPILVLPIHEFPRIGCTITDVRLRVDGGTGHAGFDMTLPSFALYSRASLIGTWSQVGSTANDTSADLTAYEQPHTITLSGLSHTPLPGSEMIVVVTGESGTNAETFKLTVTGLDLLCTATGMGPR